jgi:hypothetical protein
MELLAGQNESHVRPLMDALKREENVDLQV